MVVGAVSVAIWGSPRTSQDLDFIIYLKDADIKKFTDFCKKNKLVVNEKEIKEALKKRSHVAIFDDESAYRLDIKGIYDELDMITFSRRTKVKFRDFEIWVNTLEYSILAKLVYRSPQDMNDAKSMLLRQKGKLDMAHLKEQAMHLRS